MTIVNFADKTTSGLDEDAVTTTTPGERVFNFGRLTTSGDLADGIFAEADGVLIHNFGRIETGGLGAAGIFVRGDDARIVNLGLVETHGTLFGDDEFFAEGIAAEGDRFNIANFGRVHVDGEFSSCMSGIGANGVIVNYSVVDSAANGSSVVAVRGDGSRIANAGRVTVRGENNAALFVLGEEARAVNFGTILIDGDENVGLQGVQANTNLANKGTIRIDSQGSDGMAGFGDGHQVSNSGRIETHGDLSTGIKALGVVLFGIVGTDLEIDNSGRVTTDGNLGFGLSLGLTSVPQLGGFLGFIPAENSVIRNSGVVETRGDGAAGAVLCGSDNQLINSGRIVANGGEFAGEPFGPFRAAGVVVTGDDALVQNSRSGVILSKNADSAAVEINTIERDGLSNPDTSCRLENSGLIKGTGIAVLCGAGKETVVNHGRIVGDVVLGDGADTFVSGKGGLIAGDVVLGGGDDLVFIEDGSGTTPIADFGAGDASGDVVDVSAFFSNFADLQSHSSQRGTDTVVRLDGNDCLVLQNTQVSALTDGDFAFA
jgi:hypothetical protein